MLYAFPNIFEKIVKCRNVMIHLLVNEKYGFRNGVFLQVLRSVVG